MVFNTGSALLDAIVLAAVSKEAEGTYGYKITQEKQLIFRNRRCIRFFEGSRKIIAWKFMIWQLTGGTGDIIS